MLKYRPDLKQRARAMRSNLTDAEQKLWLHLRRRQILGVQFYRQRPIGTYITDFCAPSIGLIVEVDGAQHSSNDQAGYDYQRTNSLAAQGYRVVRFDNLQVLLETEAVLSNIYAVVASSLATAKREIA